MAVDTFIKLDLKSKLAAATPYSGGNEARVLIDEHLASGTGASQADKVHQSSRSISGSGNEDVDLTALTDAAGAALSLAEVVALVIQAGSANAGNLQVKPSAANGWSALQSGSTNHLKVLPGATVILYCPPAAAYAVSGASKSINVENAGGSTATYTLTVIGRSA